MGELSGVAAGVKALARARALAQGGLLEVRDRERDLRFVAQILARIDGGHSGFADLPLYAVAVQSRMELARQVGIGVLATPQAVGSKKLPGHDGEVVGG